MLLGLSAARVVGCQLFPIVNRCGAVGNVSEDTQLHQECRIAANPNPDPNPNPNPNPMHRFIEKAGLSEAAMPTYPIT